ncbi:MAG: tRNA pseudouridine(55) synthase TruB [Pseudomonadota bacterium]
MGRRKKGRPISGWIVLDKDYDFGSTEAVSKVRWLFQAQKAGHAGTLDPLATGILPIALGEATKTVPYVMEAEKLYRFTAKWGEATTTDDSEGDIIQRTDGRPSREAIEACLDDYVGDIEQVPPKFSAIKVGGNRAYDLARDGQEVELAARTISIHALDLVDIPDTDHAVFETRTGKGAYVRALVRDMAVALGTVGHITALRRVAVGPFHEDDAVTLAQIDAELAGEARDSLLEGLDLALRDLPATSLDGPQAMRLTQGQAAIASPAQAKGIRGDRVGEVEAVLATLHGDPVAICCLDGLKLKPVRVFNTPR